MIPVKTVWIFKDKKSSKKTAPNTRVQNPQNNTTTKRAKLNCKHKKPNNPHHTHSKPNNPHQHSHPTLQITLIASSTSASQPKQEQTHYV
ncbi:hypothetical protein [Candidatus Bathycorpusculum sp.]|uniref:hypothetical protein n=1 Tax=Candidatus Bathycorpusculum sp. TaxID=2994959 RepID=UPI00282D58D5|nr:hypothetical protein [Candidatus Termitimicrobium sp.]